jgi:hypothetical protein
MAGATLAGVDRTTGSRPPLRTTLRAELTVLAPVALAARLETLTEELAARRAELAELEAGLTFGTRRLATLAAEAQRAADGAAEERIGIEDVMHLTGRSRSWVEHHPDAIPGRCQPGGPGTAVRWLKREVLRGVREGRC